jgi:hypothetical protein
MTMEQPQLAQRSRKSLDETREPMPLVHRQKRWKAIGDFCMLDVGESSTVRELNCLPGAQRRDT